MIEQPSEARSASEPSEPVGPGPIEPVDYVGLHQQVIEHRWPLMLDITGPELPVEIEIDERRGVLYVHVNGYTPLRICRLPGRTIVRRITEAGEREV